MLRYLPGLIALAILPLACGDRADPVNAVQPLPANVHNVLVTPDSATLNPGDQLLLIASVDADPSVKNRRVTWSSANPAIASVDLNGLVTAGTTTGTVAIAAISNANPNFLGASFITVVPPGTQPTKVTVTSINGTYSGSGAADQNSCNLASPVVASAIVSVDGSGHGALSLTYTVAGTTFTAPIVAALNGTTISFSGGAAPTIGGQTYNETDNGSWSGNTLTDTQTLVSQGAGACVARYNFTFTRQ